MANSRLDLLPLLDVFMVVLFVFATIQEQRLDDTSRDKDRLEERVAQVEGALREAQAGGQSRDARREEEQAESSQQRELKVVELKHEAEHLRQELRQARETFAAQRDKTRADLERAGVPEAALERIEVLSRVLDKYSVFEIEVVGDTADDGGIRNRCCYRVDPLDDEWVSCGDVPPRTEDRQRWLDTGAGGLADALRRTKGGNAMTLVRQDHAAGHRIASRLVDQLRDGFSDQHFYAEEEPLLPDHCGTGPAPQ